MFKKQLILFYPGGSGQFLSQFLSHDWDKSEAKLRLDTGIINELQAQDRQVYMIAGKSYDRWNEEDRNKICEMLENGNNQIILSHHLNISDFRKYSNEVWTRKIFPKTNVFGMIKNNQLKKYDLELTNYTTTNLGTRVDNIFLIMHELYKDLRGDKDTPDDLTIDFGMLYDIDFLIDQHKDVHGYRPHDEKIAWAEKYIELQFEPIEDCDYKDIDQLIEYIQPKDPFDVALLIYLYEKNNDTIDIGRLGWSIDKLPNSIDDAVLYIKENSKRYSKFE